MTATDMLRLAIDIGGTFTDTVLVEGEDTILASTKTLTTHGNPADGAMEGAARVMAQSGRSLDQVTGFIHGTTLATNALIERRGATVATVTTEGFRDILEIAYERRYSQYDINLEKPDLLVPRERALTVRERMSADGTVLIEMEEAAIDALLDDIDASGAEAVAICLMHSYANPTHERRLRDVLISQYPNLTVSISSDVSPEAREFDRLCTTVANAYIQPLMESYLNRFVEQFAGEGVTCPILMMTAGGGMCTVETAARFPIRLVESGPAGGAILAARIAARAGIDQVLSFDVGGTTAKLCLIDSARPQTSRQFEIARAARFIKGSGMPVRIPVIEMIEIGAGGGSIAGVDRLGRLTVGPKSAGSEPGPVAFGRGGTEPTVTDSDITLGYIVPDTFAEGHISIDPEASKAALTRLIGAKLNTGAMGSADGVSRIVDESMASAGRMHAVESGKDLGPRTMIAFGGNGPLHATRVARSAGVSRIVIPPNPGVGSAVGFLFAPVSFEIVRSRYSVLDTLELDGVNALFDEMIAEAKAVVAQGAGDRVTETRRSAFMRYNGQGHEIEIALPDRALEMDDIQPLIRAFEEEYRKQFSRPVPGMQIEILNWAVQVATPDDAVPPTPQMPDLNIVKPGETRSILCDVEGTMKQAGFVSRDSLSPGQCISGPALITEPQTTTLVSADFSAHVDAIGNLVLNKNPSSSEAVGGTEADQKGGAA
ncbi:hydantoinase/oxoprolinase family protein [Falsiruegeria mediterranea]|uniref:Acetophenone carboxylase gamma subunit n=1 Tax=Falsiruegeria mediterranea M17 TaxID=1200281 RepID=A0A2R8C384_9RHOB|nr:hydantoinase/oxoprolinase family protein [Falsiruegeria mediterranea]SPJ26891.1 Acetophenone carboxylase gamma subunit [Falsiruegeria mediterranea M17]